MIHFHDETRKANIVFSHLAFHVLAKRVMISMSHLVQKDQRYLTVFLPEEFG